MTLDPVNLIYGDPACSLLMANEEREQHSESWLHSEDVYNGVLDIVYYEERAGRIASTMSEQTMAMPGFESMAVCPHRPSHQPYRPETCL